MSGHTREGPVGADPLTGRGTVEADTPKEGHMDPITQAIAITVDNGGGTFEQGTLLPFSPGRGYAVAVGGARIGASAPLNVIGMLLKVIPQEYEASFVGTWLDGQVLYIDAVEFIIDRDRALARGHETGQVAIFDFAAGESIYLQEVTA